MGNEYGHYGGYGDGIDRRDWAPISNRAQRGLDEAKGIFHEFVRKYSFDNVPDENYKFTKKHAIPKHLVHALRPKFNKYVRRFGAKPKWNSLSPMEKLESGYKHRKSAIYFCDLTIDRTVRENLEKAEPTLFQREYSKMVAVETTPEYLANPPATKRKRRRSVPKSSAQTNSSATGPSRTVKRVSRKTARKHSSKGRSSNNGMLSKNVLDLCSESEEGSDEIESDDERQHNGDKRECSSNGDEKDEITDSDSDRRPRKRRRLR